MFRRTFPIAILAVLAGLASSRFTSTPTARAQETQGCTNAILSGPYAYATRGFILTPDGQLGLWAASGRIVADGNGSFTAVESSSLNGIIRRNRKYSGTYNVTPECTGSLQVVEEGGANLDFTILDGGKEAVFIQTDQGTIISGSAKKQW